MGSDAESTAPDRAFWLLSDETRIAILRAVWDASADPVSFSDLRAAVGAPDSGRFNYHIDKLTGHFLSKADGGYTLTQAGREVIRAVLAGTLTEQPRLDPEPIDGHCADCGSSLVAEYDEYGVIECRDCETTVMWNEFPPAGLEDRDPEAFARAFDRWTQHRFRMAIDGICPSCASGMSVHLPHPPANSDGERSVLHRCENCEYEARVPLFGHVIQHPAVVSVYYESGLDVTAMPYWELQALARAYTEDVVSTDPWRAHVTIETDEHSLRLTLDDSLAVSDVNRLE